MTELYLAKDRMGMYLYKEKPVWDERERYWDPETEYVEINNSRDELEEILNLKFPNIQDNSCAKVTIEIKVDTSI